MANTNIKDILDYIEKNVFQSLTVYNLADTFQISEEHLSRLFKKHTGIPPAEYIRRLKLSLAAADILENNSVTETSSMYGFDTPSGFSKAFRKCYGMSAQEYKATYCTSPTPKFECLPELCVVAYTIMPKDANLQLKDAGAYWLGNDFSDNVVPEDDWNKLMTPNKGEIGAWIPEDASPTGLKYIFGPIVEETSFIPDKMELFTLPASEYAVFEVPKNALYTQLAHNIISLWNITYSDWFANGKLKYDNSKVAFELYKGDDTFIYIPIVKNEE